jgi:DNA polymerase
VQELALGYGGGVGAFLTFATAYNLDLDAMADEGAATIPAEVWSEAERFWDWSVEGLRNVHDLPKKTFIVCDSFKRMWRNSHPNIKAFWYEIEDAVRWAITNSGNTTECRGLRVRRDGAWLRIILPSGRALCYPAPQVSDDRSITYMGMNQYTRKWQRLGTYGGKLFENICQAVARDVLAHGMTLAEKAGYEIVLTVHDEIIAEVPDSPEFSVAGLAECMTTVPAWAVGLPLAAAGFETYRYRKD